MLRNPKKIGEYAPLTVSILSSDCSCLLGVLKKKEILDGTAGGCDRWRYRDESLVNVATGRAITMTSTPVSPASSASSSSSSSAGETGRQLLLVPKDKSFATQKFLVMTSGSIVAKDNAFVVAVEDRMRGWCPFFCLREWHLEIERGSLRYIFSYCGTVVETNPVIEFLADRISDRLVGSRCQRAVVVVVVLGTRGRVMDPQDDDDGLVVVVGSVKGAKVLTEKSLPVALALPFAAL